MMVGCNNESGFCGVLWAFAPSHHVANVMLNLEAAFDARSDYHDSGTSAGRWPELRKISRKHSGVASQADPKAECIQYLSSYHLPIIMISMNTQLPTLTKPKMELSWLPLGVFRRPASERIGLAVLRHPRRTHV